MSAPVAFPSLDLILGPIVVGTAFSLFLNGILTTQIYTYFMNYPKDPVWMKIMVWYFLITDYLHTGIETSVIYTYTVTWFAQYLRIGNANLAFAFIPVTSVAISSVAQSFFAWRVARLTHQPILGWAIGFFALVQFFCGIGVTIAVWIVKAFDQFQKFEFLVIPWLASSVVCDIIITGSLTWYLSRNKSGIKGTDDIVTRIIRLTVQTGMITTLWAILDLIVYLTEANSLHLLFNLPLAKIYTNSLMSNLNARRSQFEGSTAVGTSGQGISKLRNGGANSTLSIPTWDRGYGNNSQKDTKLSILQTTTTEYTHTQVHHDIGGDHARRTDSDFDEYEMQHKRPIDSE